MRLRRRRRVAIAGAGGAAGVHAASTGPAGGRVMAVASADGRSARALAGEAGGRCVRAEDLPAGADVLVVATPTETHLELAARGARAGALVLVESPWWSDSAEAAAAVAADVAGPGRIRGASNLRSSPLWRRLLQERRTFGAPNHVSGSVVQPVPTWGHLSRRAAADGPLVRLGAVAVVHGLDLLDPSWPTVRSVRAGRAGDSGWLELLTDVATVHLEVAHAPESAISFQAATDDGVLRVEFAPDASLERDGEPLAVPAADAGTGTDAASGSGALRAAGYVDQLARLGTPEDLTLDAPRTAVVTAILSAAAASADCGGGPVEPAAG